MDFVCDIVSCIGNILNFLFDKLWWKDYGIPLIGTVGVPLVVWILTRYYGADKAEERKEIRQLKDNLDFLTSVSLISLNSLDFLKKRLNEIHTKITNINRELKDNRVQLEQINLDEICYGFVFDNVFNSIELPKYAGCIEYNPMFMENIILVKSLLSATKNYIDERNQIISSLASCENNTVRLNRYQGFIKSEQENMDKFIFDVHRMVILLVMIIGAIQEFPQKIKKLRLINVKFTESQMRLIKEAENAAPKKDEDNDK